MDNIKKFMNTYTTSQDILQANLVFNSFTRTNIEPTNSEFL